MSHHPVSRRAVLTGAGAGLLTLMAPTGIASAATAVKVYVAGDSTASTYGKSSEPRAGWGQALPVFLTSAATVVNHAKSGASSKSFVDSGLLTPILNSIKAGDFLLISFGHNDEKTDDPARYTDPATTYKTYLSKFIDGAVAKGAKPVLVTPVERRRFNSAGVAQTSHGAYPAAMKELGAACAASARIDSAWGGGFVATITVRNVGADTLSSWYVSWRWSGDERIVSLWNGVSQDSSTGVRIGKTSWNGTLSPSATTTFGIVVAAGSPPADLGLSCARTRPAGGAGR